MVERLSFRRASTAREYLGPGPTRIVAHRGFAAVAPENTLAAVRGAVAAGADMVEVDVRMTADGHLVCLHDGRLERTTNGHGAVHEARLSDLLRLDAGAWFGPGFVGQRVPTLPAVLAAMRGRALLNVEVKSDGEPDPRLDRFAEVLLGQLRDHRMLEHVIVSSYEPRVLRRLRRLESSSMLAAVVGPESSNALEPLRAVHEASATALHLDHRLAVASVAGQCRAEGVHLSVFTVNDRAEAGRLARIGAAALFTDRPDLVSEVRVRSSAV